MLDLSRPILRAGFRDGDPTRLKQTIGGGFEVYYTPKSDGGFISSRRLSWSIRWYGPRGVSHSNAELGCEGRPAPA